MNFGQPPVTTNAQDGNSTLRITPVPLTITELDFFNNGRFGVIVSPTFASTTAIPSTQYQSNMTGSMVFSATAPSPGVCLSKNLFMEMSYRVKLYGTPNTVGGKIYNRGFSAPRFLPSNQIIATTNIKIGNTTVVLNTNTMVGPLYSCNMQGNVLNHAMSGAPTMRDTTQRYNDPYTSDQLKGIVNDPLATWGQRPFEVQQPRGAFPVTVVAEGTGPSDPAIIEFTTYEPFVVSPFDFQNYGPGIIGLNTISFTMTFATNLSQIWSQNYDNDASSPLTAVTCELIANPALHVTWLTPPPNIIIPKIQYYKYSTTNYFQTDNGGSPTAAGATFKITSNNIQFDQIPNRLIVYVSRKQNDLTAGTTNTYANITGVTINFDNQTGINSSCSEIDLYAQSARNGYQGSFTDWHNGMGSVYILDTGVNLNQSNPSEAPGMLVTKQFLITVAGKNISTEAMNLTLTVIVVNNGLLVNDNGNWSQYNAVLTPNDVEMAKSQTIIDTIKPSTTIYGGKLASGGAMSLGKIISQAAGDIGKANKWLMNKSPLSNGMNYMQKNYGFKAPSGLTKAIKWTGYGAPMPLVTGSFAGGGQDAMEGGAYMSNTELHKRARSDPDCNTQEYEYFENDQSDN